MTGTRAVLVRGYVLHQRPWRNTSLLVEAFTTGAGRIGLVARGVRSRNGRRRALLEPFQPLLLSWSGRGELHTLTGVEAERWRSPPAGRALLAAYYCSELILRLLGRDDPNPDAFAAYDAVVAELAAGRDEAPALRCFEFDLLVALGFAPPLTTEVESGRAVDAGTDYDYVAEVGPLPVSGPAGSHAVRVSGRQLQALEARRFDEDDVLRAARRILQASLRPLLGSKPLRTRELYRSMYGAGGGSGERG